MDEYDEAISRVLKIREQRKHLYSDGWKDNEDWVLLGAIKMKTGRFQHLLFNESESDYEKEEDCLVDLINYALFILANRIRKEHDFKDQEFIEDFRKRNVIE